MELNPTKKRRMTQTFGLTLGFFQSTAGMFTGQQLDLVTVGFYFFLYFRAFLNRLFAAGL